MRCRPHRCAVATIVGVHTAAVILASVAATTSPAWSQDAAALAKSRAVCTDKSASADDAIAACTHLVDAAQAMPRERAEALVLRAEAHYARKHDDRVIDDCNAAIRLDRTFAKAFKFRADAHHRKGDDDRAIADYTEAIRLDPHFARAYNNLGNVHWKRKDGGRAVEHYSAAIRLDPALAEPRYNRAGVHFANQDYGRAIADYSEAIRIDPRNAPAFYNRGRSLRQTGDLDGAIADYDAALRINPGFAAAINGRGYAYQLKGDHDRAIADYSEAIRLDPKNELAYMNRGIALRRSGRNDEAIADFDEVLKVNQKHASAFYQRGSVHLDRKDYGRAMADFDKAIGLDPRHASAFNGRGNVHFARKNYDRAIEAYSQAIKIDPKYAAAYYNRGLSRRNKDQIDKALVDLNESARLAPKDVATFYSLAQIHRTRRDFDRAIAHYGIALEIDPTYAAALTGRGLVYEAMRDPARARTDFDNALRQTSRHVNSKWAHDTARARLALLGGPETPAPVTRRPQGDVGTPSSPSVPPPAVPGADSGARIALVIGNGAYRAAPVLPNPPNDARAMAAALRDIGFTVVSATDLDNVGMSRVILDFLRRTAAARIALVYYAGHGVQIDGRNYLVPIDASELVRATAPVELFDLDRLLAGLDDEARANIVILDSCRDNPMETKSGLTRSGSRGGGLAAYANVASGMLIAFATAPGQTAEDGRGDHSPFTNALLKHLRTPRLEINQMLNRVRADVRSATGKAQTPWTNSSLMGDVYLGR